MYQHNYINLAQSDGSNCNGQEVADGHLDQPQNPPDISPENHLLSTLNSAMAGAHY